MSIFEYNQELHMKNLKEEYTEEGIIIGKEEGIAIGKEEGITIGKEEGITIGKEEGITIGKKEGITIGKEEGIREGLISTVAIMKKIQVPESTIIAEIMEKFHLPKDEAVRFVKGAATKQYA